jgi:hypothetical protein
MLRTCRRAGIKLYPKESFHLWFTVRKECRKTNKNMD